MKILICLKETNNVRVLCSTTNSRVRMNFYRLTVTRLIWDNCGLFYRSSQLSRLKLARRFQKPAKSFDFSHLMLNSVFCTVIWKFLSQISRLIDQSKYFHTCCHNIVQSSRGKKKHYLRLVFAVNSNERTYCSYLPTETTTTTTIQLRIRNNENNKTH